MQETHGKHAKVRNCEHEDCIIRFPKLIS